MNGTTDERRLPFLDRVDERARERLLQMGTHQEYAPKQPLMRTGEPGEFVMLLRHGFVKVTSVDQEGTAIILDVGVPGDLHGEIAVVAGGTRMADVVAIDRVQARRIGAGEFERFLSEHPSAMKELLVSVSRRFVVAQQQRTQSWKPQAITRVARRLDYLIDACGIETEQGWRIGIPLSQDELAQFIPMGRTMVAKALNTLRDEGIVASARRSFTVTDRSKLRERADTEV
ncbi:Crp/Fnr family transcriptional regulator [Amycolatopsis samaneae]|uniref:Crp/Fnr family transcriptional regulator n=1 Tax=Amycolatopsis samaneae TaxID=664691 RepID=A0ABW5G7V3_9PSEU